MKKNQENFNFFSFQPKKSISYGNQYFGQTTFYREDEEDVENSNLIFEDLIISKGKLMNFRLKEKVVKNGLEGIEDMIENEVDKLVMETFENSVFLDLDKKLKNEHLDVYRKNVNIEVKKLVRKIFLLILILFFRGWKNMLRG